MIQSLIEIHNISSLIIAPFKNLTPNNSKEFSIIIKAKVTPKNTIPFLSEWFSFLKSIKKLNIATNKRIYMDLSKICFSVVIT